MIVHIDLKCLIINVDANPYFYDLFYEILRVECSVADLIEK